MMKKTIMIEAININIQLKAISRSKKEQQCMMKIQIKKKRGSCSLTHFYWHCLSTIVFILIKTNGDIKYIDQIILF